MAKRLVPKTVAVTVTTAGTAVPISATEIPSAAVLVVAQSTNTGNVYVGGVDVSSSNAEPLGADDAKELVPPTIRGIDEETDLSKIYIDADTNGEGVFVTYWVRE